MHKRQWTSPYNQGQKNMDYINPNFIPVGLDANNKRNHQTALNPVQVDDTRSRSQISKRRHDAEDAKSNLGEGSRVSKTTRTTQKSEIRPKTPTQPSIQEEAPVENQNQNTSPVVDAERAFVKGAREVTYKYHSDDQLFPIDQEFTPGHNFVANSELIPGHFQNKEYDAFNPYEDNLPQANAFLAQQKKMKAEEEKRQGLQQDWKYLDNLAAIEERKLQEQNIRKLYCQQIDEYHKGLAVPSEDPVKRAIRLRDQIRVDAEELEIQVMHDEQVHRERQKLYNQELSVQNRSDNGRRANAMCMNSELERQHIGLPLPNRETVIDKAAFMNSLDAQIDARENRHEAIRQWEAANPVVNDYLLHKKTTDAQNINILVQNRDRYNVAPNNKGAKERELEIKQNDRMKAKEENARRLQEYEQVNAQIAYEKSCLQNEYLRRAHNSEGLKKGLLNQMKNNNNKSHNEVVEDRAYPNNFTIGGGGYRFENCDLRPDLQLKHERLNKEHNDAKMTDAKLVSQLDQ